MIELSAKTVKWAGTGDPEDRAAAMPQTHVRRHAALDGLKRLATRFERTGRKKAAKKLGKFAEEAETALAEFDAEDKRLGVKRPDPLAKAHAKAAKQLQAALPDAFPCEADALAFARRLPMSDAVKEATAVLDKLQVARRAQKKIERRFWDAIAMAGRIGLGSMDDDANTRELVNLGL
ncbi:MAG: hypothetical protein AB7V14_00575 [Kiritimatiellia bacterium]